MAKVEMSSSYVATPICGGFAARGGGNGNVIVAGDDAAPPHGQLGRRNHLEEPA